jgi:hypothetical protein
VQGHIAEGVHGLMADEDIVIRTLSAVWVIPGQSERYTGLPLEARRRQRLPVGCGDIPAPEVLAQTQTPGQFKDDPGVRAGLTARGNDWGTPLHERLSLLADIKPDLEGFALPGRCHWQDNVGQGCGGSQEQIGIDTKLQRLQRGIGPAGVGVGDEEVGPEADERVPYTGCLRGWRGRGRPRSPNRTAAALAAVPASRGLPWWVKQS